ncbi:hypothetical protein OC835_001463 [Tilletia horrida]|nr:hypothetical protein OC835_001463 [Tilletia horrida]
MSYHIEAEEAYDGEDSLSSDDDASWDDQPLALISSQPMLTQSILRAAKELRRDLRRAADKGTFRDRSRPSDFYAPASTGLSNPHTASAPPQASQSPRGHSETTDSLNVHGALMPFQPSQLTRRADDGETDLAPPPLQWGGSTPPTPPQSSQTTAAAQGVGVELVVRMSSPRPKASGRQVSGATSSTANPTTLS